MQFMTQATKITMFQITLLVSFMYSFAANIICSYHQLSDSHKWIF